MGFVRYILEDLGVVSGCKCLNIKCMKVLSEGKSPHFRGFKNINHRKGKAVFPGPLHVNVCVFAVAGCGPSDRAGEVTQVEITALFAWAVICVDELSKS